MQNNSNTTFFGEKWKNVKFNFEYSNNYRLEVSNFGRIRSYNKLSEGNILKGSITEGYNIIRLKFFKAEDPSSQKKLQVIQNKTIAITKKLLLLKASNENVELIAQTTEELKKQKKVLSLALAQHTKERTINYHSLIHRLVANYFLPKPPASKTIVAHIDYNKVNNDVKNLSWMTPEENYAHQKLSPFVIEEKAKRIYNGSESSRSTKLTITKVMFLKKLLNEGKTVKQMVKQFKVSDMQIIRIKRGENWRNVPAAV